MAGKRKHIRRVSSEIRLLESELRETESSVSAELQSDEAEALQRAKLQERATQAFRQHEEAKACLGEMNKRIPSLVRRKDLSDDQQTQLSKIVQGASVAANRLLRIDDAKSQILKQLEDAHALCDSLKDLGSYRDHTVLHALNGLANTKVNNTTNNLSFRCFIWGVSFVRNYYEQFRFCNCFLSCVCVCTWWYVWWYVWWLCGVA
eukprot:m.100827 g.100827  ORF g.100827 m.100827 type:complete len:205 (-) comp13184_c0_seq4:149-763(-)